MDIKSETEFEKRKMLQDNIVTEHKKKQFINEIKNGLGLEIIKPKEPKKLSFFEKLKKIIGWN